MKFKKPVNENYCGTIFQIKNTFPLQKCDMIQSTIIFGNSIIISKDVKVGDIGVYFPAETQLSHEFTSKNNLYRHSEMNENKNSKGYLEDNRRIRTMKMRGNKSCGLWLPLTCLSFCCNINEFKVDDVFDEVNEIPICNKYIAKRQISQGTGKKKQKLPKISKLIQNQFRFHEDTAQFGKNAHKFEENDIVSISSKLHGTSLVSGMVLCKKKLNWFYKFLKKIGLKIIDTEYDNLFSSRKVIKNDDLRRKNSNDYYKVDIWGLANEKLKEYLLDGMTIYAEIVGFLPNGGYIQKPYDYGCESNTFEIYIYRITYTNPSGDVFEFSAKQVQDWCKQRGLNPVPELYYGKAIDIFNIYDVNYDITLDFKDNLINALRDIFLEKDCSMCKNKLPAEGIVIRKEINELEAYKFKSFRFLERETKQLDKGEVDIEEEN